MRPLALVLAVMALTTHVAGPAYAWCCSSTIAKIGQLALAGSHAPGRPKEAAGLAADERREPYLDASCLGSTDVAASPTRSMSRDAIAYAWLLIDASVYLVAADAGNDAPHGTTCLDVLQPLLGDETCPRTGLLRNLGAAVAANAQDASARRANRGRPIAANPWRTDIILPVRTMPASFNRTRMCALTSTQELSSRPVRPRTKESGRATRSRPRRPVPARPYSCWLGIKAETGSAGFRGPSAECSAILVPHARCDRSPSTPAPRTSQRRTKVEAASTGPPIRSLRRSRCCEIVSLCWSRATVQIFKARRLTSSQVSGWMLRPDFLRPATYPAHAQ